MNFKKYSVNDSSKVFLWALLLPQVASILVACVFTFIYKTQEELVNSLAYLLVLSLIAQVCFCFIAFYYNKKNKFDFIKISNIKQKINWVNILICVGVALICILGYVNFINLVGFGLEKIGFELGGVSLPLNSVGWLILNVLILGVLPAVFEEVIFRGMIFNGLKNKGFVFACLISSLMFAIEHLAIDQFVFQFIMGIVLSFIYEKTNSLVYPIITHFCNNFFVIIINYIINKTGRDFLSLDITKILNIIIAVVLAIATSVVLYFILTKLLKNKKSNEMETQIIETNTVQSEKLNKDSNVEYNKKLLVISLVCGAVLWLLVTISSFKG